MRPLPRLLLVTASLFILPLTTLAQSQPNQINPANATGIQPYNMYGGVRENINLMNGNVNLQVPLLTLPGRNGLDLGVGLEYDSKIWVLHYEINEFTDWWWWESEAKVPGGAWRLSVPVLNATWRKITSSPSQTTSCWMDFVITLSDGSKHSFDNRANCYKQIGSQWVSVPASNIPVTDSQDAAYLWLDTTDIYNVVVYLKDGTRVQFFTNLVDGGNESTVPYTKIANKIVDSDGNFINLQSQYDGVGTGAGAQVIKIIDTVGREVDFVWTSGRLTSITYKDSGGTPRTITLAYSGFTVNPSFSKPLGNYVVGGGTWQMLSTITLPNNLTYTFDYNNFGELSKITYPTGGSTSYTYSAYTHWYEMWHTSGSSEADFRHVASRRICRESDGTCATEDVTTYTATVDSGKTNNEYVDVRDAEGNRTRHRFAFRTPLSATKKYFSPRELQRWVYEGESNLLRTVTTDYGELDSQSLPQNWSLPIRVTTTLNDTNHVTKTEYTYDTYILPGTATTRSIDNPTEVREYAFGTGAAGALARVTSNTWLKVNSVNGQDYHSTTIHIMDRKSSEVIRRADYSVVAQTGFEYDSYTEGLTASGTVQHESTFSTSYTTRGNLTAVKRWRNTDSAWLTTRNQYDDSGNLRKTTDPLSHNTTFSYTDSWANGLCTPSGGSAKAYLTSATNHLGHVTTSMYNSCSGTVATTTDPNNRATSFTYDVMGRLTQTDLPDTGQALTSYSEAAMPLSVTRTVKINASVNAVAPTDVDGLGRVTQSRLTSDPQGTVYTDTTYDALGRKKTVSNPYRSTSDPTYGITTFEYDALGRVTKVIPPDGTPSTNRVVTSYSGNCTTVTDQQNKQRKSCTDALGRLITIYEPDATGALTLVTNYTYDVLDNLTFVDHGDRDRSFTYNSLSQLTQAVNPESGATTYTYDNDGNLITKTDARSITATYFYDALHRLTRKTYSDGSLTEYFMYDTPVFAWQTNTIGRLVNMYKGTSCSLSGGEAEVFGYDSMGRLIEHRRCVQAEFVTRYQYNQAGGATQITYPSGRQVNYTYNAAGQVTQVKEANGALKIYADNINYHPHGAWNQMRISSGALQQTATFNNRLQPLVLSAMKLEPLTILMSLTYGFQHGSANNGNVMSQVDNVQNINYAYTYDELNRLKTANATNAQTWGLSWTYDRYANLLQQTVTAGSAPMLSLSVNANNRITNTGFSYDLGGNMTADGSHTYQYDAENRLKSLDSTGATYLYNGEGRRVKKTVGATATVFVTQGANGPVLTEYVNGAWSKDYIYLGSQLLATESSSQGTRYHFADHLGTPRVIVGPTGTVISRHDYYPFGAERTSWTDGETHKFTGHERDGESSLDYMVARHYAFPLGRFLQPDAPFADQSAANPQTWNLYSYVRNNPLYFVDPTGRVSVDGPVGGEGKLPGVHGGGVGDPFIGSASNYGYERYQTTVTTDTVVLLFADGSAEVVSTETQVTTRVDFNAPTNAAATTSKTTWRAKVQAWQSQFERREDVIAVHTHDEPLGLPLAAFSQYTVYSLKHPSGKTDVEANTIQLREFVIKELTDPRLSLETNGEPRSGSVIKDLNWQGSAHAGKAFGIAQVMLVDGRAVQIFDRDSKGNLTNPRWVNLLLYTGVKFTNNAPFK